MAAWDNNSNTVSRDEAQVKIKALATEKGIKGAFKVFYDGEVIADPSDLPDQVDMTLIKVSNTLDQAGK